MAASPPELDDTRFAALASVVREAGALTMRYFRRGARIAGRIDWKAGNSPVTEADLAVDAYLRERLTALFPDAGWLSEETADTPDRLDKEMVLVVDPIDGTRGFMEGDPRFAVSVALVVGGRPVAGIVEAPALRQIFSARAGRGAILNGEPIVAPRPATVSGARVAGPKFLIDPLGQRLGTVGQPKVPSLALRLAQVASGVFDIAIASTDAHDWDIAAADLILHEAGAQLRDIDGAPPAYNRAQTKHGVLIAAAAPLHAPVRDVLNDVIAGWRRRQAGG